MENGRLESSFWNFSDQLRLHTAGIGSLSLGDSIWSDPFLSATGRRPEDRRNTESTGEAAAMEIGSTSVWKMGLDLPQKLAFTSPNSNRYNNSNNLGGLGVGVKNSRDFSNGEVKTYFSKAIGRPAANHSNGSGVLGGAKKGVCSNNESGGKSGKNKKSGNNSCKDGNNNNTNSVDKRFKTLPPSEALPRSQTVGGYIFVCNNETMEENLKRQLFGLPPRYKDSVRVITPGLPIFLYNYSTHQLHGIFEAATFGGTNIDPTAWEDKKHPGESRYPAQVRVITRKNFEPLEEDSFRPILHHYDGPKFRLELSVPEALALLDVFAENND
ncbi:B2 protein-like [Phalaenopsis equestris]|uniref:B2 protein-like n=1 Tax=Phalaenopsis equestris TaxID=78828 RepID=UPI0009E265A6|nr:B2 protein-like [Phalaenopsis equestris]